MSLVTYGLGPAGIITDTIISKSIDVALESDPILDVNLLDEITSTIDTPPVIVVQLESEVDVDLKNDNIDVEKSCP